jgi:hypothetical protein
MMQSLRLIAGKLKEHLALQELLSIARIVPLDQEHPFIKASHKLTSDFQGSGEPIALTGNIVNGILLPDMLVVTSVPVTAVGTSAGVGSAVPTIGDAPKP